MVVDPAIVKYACWQRCCAGQGDTWEVRGRVMNPEAPENEGERAITEMEGPVVGVCSAPGAD